MATFDLAKTSFGAMQALLGTALELAQNLAAGGDYQALLRIAKQVIPSQASALLKCTGESWQVMAAEGYADNARAAAVSPAVREALQKFKSLPSGRRFMRAPETAADRPGAILTYPAGLVCPLRAQGQTWGLILFEADKAHAFEHFNELVIGTFSNLISAHAVAIEKAASSVAVAPAIPCTPYDEDHLPELPMAEAVDDFQRRMVLRQLKRTQGNWAEAARQLGLDRSNLHRLGRRLKMK